MEEIRDRKAKLQPQGGPPSHWGPSLKDEPEELYSKKGAHMCAHSGQKEIERHMDLVKTLLGAIALDISLVDSSLRVICDNFRERNFLPERGRKAFSHLCHLLECSPKGDEPDFPCPLCPVARAIFEIIEEGSGGKTFETPWPPKGTAYKDVRFSIRSIPYQTEGKDLFVVAWEDITRQKIWEMRIEQANRELEDTNRQLASALEKANLLAFQAEAANIAKSAFLARMSHEIRTPLNAVIGYCELLMEGKLGGEEREHASAIYTSAQALLSLINDILDFSKIEAGEINLDSMPFDLRDVVEEACEIVEPKLQGKPVKLSYRLDPSLPKKLVGDPGRTRQVIVNLLDNACKFTKEGSIDLRVTLGSLEGDKAHVIFGVKDTGIGIPSHKLEEIFEPFRQLDDSKRRAHGGTGLGLAICRQIARLMEGKVWAKSKVGEGSSFFFEAMYAICGEESGAPSEKSRESHSEKKASRQDSSSRSEKSGKLEILLVEDNQLNGRLATLMLERAGYKVVWVQDGWQALKIVGERRKHLGLIFTDVEMPGIDGLEVTRRIRSLGLQEVPIVAMTAHATKEDRERCLCAGMNDYLSKPIRKDLLIRTVERWLKERGSR